jgi:hypothetical protein
MNFLNDIQAFQLQTYSFSTIHDFSSQVHEVSIRISCHKSKFPSQNFPAKLLSSKAYKNTVKFLNLQWLWKALTIYITSLVISTVTVLFLVRPEAKFFCSTSQSKVLNFSFLTFFPQLPLANSKQSYNDQPLKVFALDEQIKDQTLRLASLNHDASNRK